jgi:C4-dicarboxylate transporter DctM subunit
MTVNLCIGTVTPPLGVDLFVASTISKVPLEKIVAYIWPYILLLLLDLLLITYYPPLSLFLLSVFK